MSGDSAANSPENIQAYGQLWAERAASVLESLRGTPFTHTHRPPAGDAVSEISEEGAVWLCFKVSGKLAGDQCFQLSKSDAVRLAQLLMSEPLDGAAALSDGLSDALAELFRQFAGVAATACKSNYGGEVTFNLEAATAKPEWTAVAKSNWVFVAPEIDPLQWSLLLGPDFAKSLDDAANAKKSEAAAEPSPPAPVATPPAPDAKPSGTGKAVARTSAPAPSSPGPTPAPAASQTDVAGAPANLDLLLDVELKASLRFGQKDMLLRDILELHTGSVIELDKQVQEPAELLVAGRVIAWGDVVIVDGNYGLRITDIAQPHHRLASVETATSK